jgi:two-component system OmpR family response regulator
VNKVLVVDDEESFTDLVSRIVEKHGLTVRTASSADEFEDIFFEFEPQVAVIDIVMPERDGFELIDWLKH